MKRILLILTLSLISSTSIWSQCATQNCSTYVATPITFTTFPSAGNNVVLSDDQMSSAFPIGFNFDFYCSTYTQFEISSNGFITFNLGTGANGCCSGQTIPGPGTPNNFIAFAWNDLYPPGGGSITYTTLGTSPNQMLVVTYTSINHCCGSSGPYNSGQIVLYEGTNVIDIYSGEVTQDGSTCTQGIENNGGTIGVAPPGRNNTTWTTQNTAYRFTTIVPITPTAVTGNTTACLSGGATFSVSGDPSVLSYVWTTPSGWTGTSTTSILNATVGASGAVSVSAVYTCGVSSPTTINFSTIPPPVVSMSQPSPALMCGGSTATINTSGALTFTLQPGNNSSGPPFYVNPFVNTVYTLSGTDNNGCVSLNNPTVIVNVLNTPTVTTNSGVICQGSSFNITPSGATIYTLSTGFSVITPTTPGVTNYTVVGTNSTGCLSQPAVGAVTVNALPNVQASASSMEICRDESVTITAIGAPAFVWNTGSTSNAITVAPFNTTTYSVTGTDANNCSKTATISIKVSVCLGLNESGAEKMDLLSIFPNPSNGEFNVKANARSEVKVYDMQGKLVLSTVLSEGQQTLDLRQQAAGQYILKAVQGNSKQEFILIKQ